MNGPAHESKSWLDEWFGTTETVKAANQDPSLWPAGVVPPKEGDVIHTPGYIEQAANKAADKLDGSLTLVVLGLVALAVIVVAK